MNKGASFLIWMALLFAPDVHGQNFPSKPITMICPCATGNTPDRYLRGFADIATKYLGQPITVQNIPGGIGTRGLATMAANARPDGYTLSVFPIVAFRVPHVEKVSWHPLRDFTLIIGIAAFTYGVVVNADSKFQTIGDLIAYAKANPDALRYGTGDFGGTPHLTMEDLAVKTGVRFVRVASGPMANVEKLLSEGRIHAFAGGVEWAPNVDSGKFRLLVTFGERRSRWNAPTALELGYEVHNYSPFGIAGPKGVDPAIVKILHDGFNRALDDPEYDRLLKRLEMVDWYKSSEEYADWAIDQFEFQRALLKRTIGLGGN